MRAGADFAERLAATHINSRGRRLRVELGEARILDMARVTGRERLVSHGFVIVGYLIVVALSRIAGDSVRPPGDRASPDPPGARR